MAERDDVSDDFDPDTISLSAIDRERVEDILEYYEKVLPFLGNMLTADICENMLHDIVDLINLGSESTGWKVYIEDMMGNPSIYPRNEIAKIVSRAKRNGQLPLYVALREPLWENLTLKHLVLSLRKQNQIPVLKDIRPHIEKCVTEMLNPSSNPNFHGSATSVTEVEKSDAAPHDAPMCEDALQKADLKRLNLLTLPDPTVPPKVLKQRVSVFVPHVLQDVPLMQKLKTVLQQKYNLDVTLLCDLKNDLEVGNNEVLNSRLSTVDFQLPFLSQRYLEQISLPNDVMCIPIGYPKWNRVIYDWMLDDYSRNSCRNPHVRAIAKEGKNVEYIYKFVQQRRIRIFEHIRLIPTNIADLVNNMISTKHDYRQWFP